LPATVICDWVPIKYYLAAKAIMYTKKKNTTLIGPTILQQDPKKTEDLWTALGKEALTKWSKDYESCIHGSWTKTLIKGPGYAG